MAVGINIQDGLVTESARNEAYELYPDSLKFDTLSVWSTGPTKDDDLVHVYIGMKDNKGRAEKLMELAFYKEDLEDGKIVNGIYSGLEQFRKSHDNTLAVLSNYWIEQKREEHILKEREKAGTIPIDRDGKPINQLDIDLINNVHGNNNWRNRLRESFEEAYRAEILFPTGYLMPKEGVISPIPKEATLEQYKYLDNKLRFEMHDPRKGDKENYVYELRTPKMKASLANYYDYIHSQNRAIRKQCIQELREEVKNAVHEFFRDKRLPNEKEIRENQSRSNQKIESVKLGLDNNNPKHQITKFASGMVKRGTRTRTNIANSKGSKENKEKGKESDGLELKR